MICLVAPIEGNEETRKLSHAGPRLLSEQNLPAEEPSHAQDQRFDRSHGNYRPCPKDQSGLAGDGKPKAVKSNSNADECGIESWDAMTRRHRHERIQHVKALRGLGKTQTRATRALDTQQSEAALRRPDWP